MKSCIFIPHFSRFVEDNDGLNSRKKDHAVGDSEIVEKLDAIRDMVGTKELVVCYKYAVKDNPCSVSQTEIFAGASLVDLKTKALILILNMWNKCKTIENVTEIESCWHILDIIISLQITKKM
ncbi:hypothetical protein TNIN_117941 [Trichonephila inaurata madagascariensis]|uniref:Uncharacterized protein n=1 Tax=Trichonephila inaurata madagascariensis TaxID=2747483 RepID=A0A8X7CL93_9ARAC|nr:hypothetical protein TNIN_117941 [Trichonephila inaurata madagascariensis]